MKQLRNEKIALMNQGQRRVDEISIGSRTGVGDRFCGGERTSRILVGQGTIRCAIQAGEDICQ